MDALCCIVRVTRARKVCWQKNVRIKFSWFFYNPSLFELSAGSVVVGGVGLLSWVVYEFLSRILSNNCLSLSFIIELSHIHIFSQTMFSFYYLYRVNNIEVIHIFKINWTHYCIYSWIQDKLNYLLYISLNPR